MYAPPCEDSRRSYIEDGIYGASADGRAYATPSYEDSTRMEERIVSRVNNNINKQFRKSGWGNALWMVVGGAILPAVPSVVQFISDRVCSWLPVLGG